MSCIAPETPGTYTDTFQMSPASGSSFGPDVTVQIVVSQAGPAGRAHCAPGRFVREQFCRIRRHRRILLGRPERERHYLLRRGSRCRPTSSATFRPTSFRSCIGSPASGLGGGLTIASRVPPTYGEPGPQHPFIDTTLVGGGLATHAASLSSLLPGDASAGIGPATVRSTMSRCTWATGKSRPMPSPIWMSRHSTTAPTRASLDTRPISLTRRQPP